MCVKEMLRWQCPAVLILACLMVEWHQSLNPVEAIIAFYRMLVMSALVGSSYVAICPTVSMQLQCSFRCGKEVASPLVVVVVVVVVV